MSRNIFLIQDSGQLIEMKESFYDSENILQTLLEDYPNLLSGDQISPNSPRKWLLVKREASVPSKEGEGGRWAADHLFLDQDAIPTIVEVKRSTDTRIRREVVGQMLDYAANAVVYWSVESLKTAFEKRCEAENKIADQELANLIGLETEAEEFWQKVKTNLQAGRIRMLFVADEIPVELRRIVEFLNEQLDPAEVLAIEIKQFISNDSKTKTLVPNVLGQTAESQTRKAISSNEKRKWDEISFFQEIENRSKPEAEIARKILAWAKSKSLRIWFGKGKNHGSFVPVVDYNGNSCNVFSVWTNGYIEIQFQFYSYRPPFADESKRTELLQKLNSISGIDLPPDSIMRRPSFSPVILQDEDNLKQFFDTFEWFISEVKSA